MTLTKLLKNESNYHLEKKNDERDTILSYLIYIRMFILLWSYVAIFDYVHFFPSKVVIE